jgi:microcystin degradation protein MlrC
VVPFAQSWVSLGRGRGDHASAISTSCSSSTRAQTFSPPVFTDLGIDLASKQIVVVKSSNHFHAAFAPIAHKVHYLDTGGPYPSDTAKIPYTKARRPLAPMDPNPWL